MASLVSAGDFNGHPSDSPHQVELKKAERWLNNGRTFLEQSFKSMNTAHRLVKSDESPGK